MIRLWFVTPAWQRYELSEICYAQRAECIAALAEAGVEGRCVVVADDGNLDLARSFGFDVVARDNRWLGRRFNDGYEYAGRRGADWIVPIGSDTWADPALFTHFLAVARERGPQNAVFCTRTYGLVRRDGLALAEIELTGSLGFGCWMLPARLLAPHAYRPCRDRLDRGCDGSLFRALQRRQRIRFEETTLHPLAVAAFRSDVQITPYERLVERHGAVIRDDPWARLRTVYSEQAVASAQALYMGAPA